MRGVVLEGIGCAGKTALISALKEELKHFGGYDVKELDHIECADQYARYLREYATQESILLHRSHVSEYVFGRILRAKRPFSETQLATLNSVMTSRFICVLAEPPNFLSFMERMGERRTRPPFTEDQYTQVVALFREAFTPITHTLYVSRSFVDLETTRDAIISKLA